MMDLKHGYPYSLIKYGLLHNYPRLQQHLETEVLVIGSGISGALCAYYVQQAGISCVVVDARTVGLGSTCASTSLLQYEPDKPLSELIQLMGEQSAKRVYTICYSAVDKLEQLAYKVGLPEFKRCNSLFFAAYKKHEVLLQKEYVLKKQLGFDVAYLEEIDVLEKYGFISPAALQSSQAGYVDAYLFVHCLLQHGTQRGLQVFDRTCVQHMEYTRKGIKAKTKEGYTISARQVIQAGGYQTEQLLGSSVVQLHSTYAFASEHMQPDTGLWKGDAVVWNTADPYLYFRMTEDKRMLVGGRDVPFYNPVKRDKLLKSKSMQLVKDMQKLFPYLSLVPEFSWTGTFGVTKDSLPFIGLHPKFPHTYFALGFGGNGIIFSLIAAEMITDAIQGIKNEDAALFDFNRKK